MIFTRKISLLFWCLFHILSHFYCNGKCLPSANLPVKDSCPSIHSCFRNWDTFITNSFDFPSTPSCECNVGCQNYGTCCADSPFLSYPKMTIRNLSCVILKENSGHGIYVVTSCADSEHPAAELCAANTTPDKDPFLFIPVTSKKTGIIYKNFFCSVCNEDIERHEVKIWPLEIYSKEGKRTSAEEMNLKTLQFVNWNWYLNGSNVFVEFNFPSEINDKRCLVEAVSSCAGNWNDTSFHQKCAEYTAYVMNQKRKVYKNPHCATCNFEKTEELVCYNDSGDYSSYSDVLFSGLWSLDDDKIKCTSKEVYDKLAQKCRVTKCVSKRYRISGRKCVPKTENNI